MRRTPVFGAETAIPVNLTVPFAYYRLQLDILYTKMTGILQGKRVCGCFVCKWLRITMKTEKCDVNMKSQLVKVAETLQSN